MDSRLSRVSRKGLGIGVFLVCGLIASGCQNGDPGAQALTDPAPAASETPVASQPVSGVPDQDVIPGDGAADGSYTGGPVNTGSGGDTGVGSDVGANPAPSASPSPSPAPSSGANPGPNTGGDPLARSTFTLAVSESARYLKDNVLEIAATLPKGTVVSLPKSEMPVNFNVRNASGGIEWSSNFYYSKMLIVSVPAASQGELTASRIAALNATSGGLFISSTVIDTLAADSSQIPVLKPAQPSADYLTYYQSTGKPKSSYPTKFQERFGTSLNKVVALSTQSAAEQRKWQAILEELQSAVNRTVPTESSLLFLSSTDLANTYSIQYEQKGIVQKEGAYSIAVNATAVRHGFANVPCAEFQSELIRQAYARAGYKHTDDFNAAKGNELIWSKTAAVVNLANALQKAGWIPWEASKYKPVTGAPAMHYLATTPGHAYTIAGDNGRFIVDNGSPRGRDLRATTAKIIDMMYLHGVFFLPPGIIPEKW